MDERDPGVPFDDRSTQWEEVNGDSPWNENALELGNELVKILHVFEDLITHDGMKEMIIVGPSFIRGNEADSIPIVNLDTWLGSRKIVNSLSSEVVLLDARVDDVKSVDHTAATEAGPDGCLEEGG
jgi:hypothetical protein